MTQLLTQHALNARWETFWRRLATRWSDLDLFDADPEKYWHTSRRHHLDAAGAYEVAADAYEEAGKMREARSLRKRAKELRDIAARYGELAEKARRILQSSSTWSGKRLRDPRRRAR